jgi:4a-hydroxytetrahydrobiopterin dehydratase
VLVLSKSREDLIVQKCVPCEGGIPPLDESQIKGYLPAVPSWELLEKEPKSIQKTFEFKDFEHAIEFVNEVAELAEDEGHHPDILIRWNKVTLTLYTHAIKGLHENDFILAAKIDSLLE